MFDETLIYKEFVTFTNTGVEGFYICFTGEKINFKIWFDGECWQIKQAGSKCRKTLCAIKARLFQWFQVLTNKMQNEN